MNKKFMLAGLLLVGTMQVAGMSAPAIAAKPQAPIVLQTAAVEGGRSLQVVVAQSEIKSDINPSNVAAATGGGLLGGLIGAAIDSAKAKKAEVLIAPIRTATADFDSDTLAIDTAKKSFGDMDWFKANPSDAFSKDSSVAGKSTMLDNAKTKQVAFAEYIYDMTPNFDAVRVVAKIEIANSAIPASAKGKGEKRLNFRNMAFTRAITSIVLLKNSTGDKETNAPLWSENNGALTRKALEQAFANLVPLTQRTMSLTAEDYAILNNKKNKRANAAGYIGRPQPAANDRSTLLWEGTFINVETME